MKDIEEYFFAQGTVFRSIQFRRYAYLSWLMMTRQFWSFLACGSQFLHLVRFNYEDTEDENRRSSHMVAMQIDRWLEFFFSLFPCQRCVCLHTHHSPCFPLTGFTLFVAKHFIFLLPLFNETSCCVSTLGQVSEKCFPLFLTESKLSWLLSVLKITG